MIIATRSTTCANVRKRAEALVQQHPLLVAEMPLLLPLLPRMIEEFSRLNRAQLSSLKEERHDRKKLMHAGSKKTDTSNDENSFHTEFALVAHFLHFAHDWLCRCLTLLSEACPHAEGSGEGNMSHTAEDAIIRAPPTGNSGNVEQVSTAQEKCNCRLQLCMHLKYTQVFAWSFCAINLAEAAEAAHATAALLAGCERCGAYSLRQASCRFA